MNKHHSPEDLIRIADAAAKKFHGSLPELESAIGMLFMGKQFGWKVLYLVHSKATVRKYENILGIKAREFFPDEGPFAHKSVGLKMVKGFSNFWKAVTENTDGVRNAKLVK